MNEAAATGAGIVTLLTDFGLTDPFVGVMKGVMLGIASGLRFVDLTHGIAPGDIRGAGFWLERSYAYFPRGATHLAVVDPGVGTQRCPLALSVDGHCFVGPDNGLFTRVLDAALAHGANVAAHVIDVTALRTRLALAGSPSRTFHGRDVFGPAAALLASGAPIASLGARVDTDELVREPRSGEPSVVIVDHFGNLITDAVPSDLALVRGVDIGGKRLRLVGTYGEAKAGECVALLGSFGTLEIAVRDGSAARVLGVAAGEPVRVVDAP